MNSSYRLLRRKISAAGLIPHGALARITVYLAGLVILLLIVQVLLAAVRLPGAANTTGAWAKGLSFPTVLLALVLLLRFVRRRLLWRLRNRLIVTYVFIGVIPVALLLIMFGLAGYFFAGQFATFLATSDLHSEIAALGSANNEVAAEIATELRDGLKPERAAEAVRSNADLAPLGLRQVTFWYQGREFSVVPAQPNRPERELPSWLLHQLAQSSNGEFLDITSNSGRLHLNAVRLLHVGQQQVVVASSRPLDRDLLAHLANGLGVISIYRSGGESDVPLVRGGSLPAEHAVLDFGFSFPTPITVRNWENGAETIDILVVGTRNSLLYGRLGATVGQYSSYLLIFLFTAAGVLAIIELLALFVGIRLTRTITLSVYELYRATQSVNRGDFSRRIPVRSSDQLAALESSFNSMTASLEKLLAEQKEKQRIESELAIAQEVQNQLFPHEAAQLASLELYGTCRPARSVSGDYYDFLPLNSEQLVIAVGDISGKGISAALLMATLHSAVRSFLVLHSREVAAQPAFATASGGGRTAVADAITVRPMELAPAQWLELLNRHLYHSTPASKYATLFLGEYNDVNRTLTYSNGGHLAPLIISRNGQVRRLEAGGMVIGLFDGMQYTQESVQLAASDIFLAYSDGITEPENEFGEFGEERLIELTIEHSAQPLQRIGEEILTAVSDWIGGAEQPDDMTIVLARAR